MRGASIGERLFDIINALLLTVIVAVTLYPLLYVFFGSLSEPFSMMAHRGLLLWPIQPNLDAYGMVFENPNIVRSYLNTIFIVVVGVSLNILLTSIGAYILSRKNVFWRNLIMFMIVLTMYINGGMVPFFFIVKGLGLVNSLWSVIIPFAVNTFYLILMRTAFAAIPDSMEESAKIDGANDYIVLFRIIMPLALPVIAVMILYYGVDRWNGWFWASIFINERSKYPLQIILREILTQNDSTSMTGGYGANDTMAIGEIVKYAVIIVATLPILFVYPFLQKYFVKGVMIGALKG